MYEAILAQDTTQAILGRVQPQGLRRHLTPFRGWTGHTGDLVASLERDDIPSAITAWEAALDQGEYDYPALAQTLAALIATKALLLV